MKRTKQRLLILLGGILMFSFFGCSGPKYKLQFDGNGFESQKTEYASGEQVTVYFRMIATDTDYRFWLDDDSVKLTQDWENGYVFTFRMPAHNVTLHMESRNSMAAFEQIRVTFRNELETADVWVLPQTEETMKTTLWGTASAGKLGAGETAELCLTEESAFWLIRIIDDENAYYAAQDVTLENGYEIVFRSDGDKFDAVIETLDRNGSVVFSQAAFTGVLGG